MYEFHYDYTENKYGKNSGLLFSDTGSLTYKIKTEDVYEDFSKGNKKFHFRKYSTKSKFYDDSNKLVVGKIKNETARVIIK